MVPADTPTIKPSDASSRCVVILCVDRDVRDLIRYWAEQSGITVAIVDNGHEAAEKLRDAAFRLLVTDRLIPPWPGLGTVIALKELHPELRIVVVEDRDPFARNLAKVVGADVTLTRPLRRGLVLSALT